MNLDIFIILDKPNKIKIYDISSPDLTDDVFKMDLTVFSSKISTDSNTKYFNLLEYLSTVRESDELFILTSNMLGFSEESKFPDGVYKFVYIINDNIRKDFNFLIYQNIKDKIDTLIKESEYKVNIGDYNMTYINDDVSNKYDIEKLRYVIALYDKLLSYTQEPNEVEVNNLLDKIERLLTIINNEI